MVLIGTNVLGLISVRTINEYSYFSILFKNFLFNITDVYLCSVYSVFLKKKLPFFENVILKVRLSNYKKKKATPLYMSIRTCPADPAQAQLGPA